MLDKVNNGYREEIPDIFLLNGKFETHSYYGKQVQAESGKENPAGEN